jgi:predicted dehydrogenase
MTRDLSGGLVGCGSFAANHLHAWRVTEGARIVALCDRREDRRDEYARRFDIRASYETLEAMLAREELDFVDIVTTPETHRELVETAAAGGVHVVCQKPLAPSLRDAEAMVRACEAAGVRFMVHENFRWQRPMREARGASAALGAAHFLRLTFHSGHDVYAGQPYLARDARFIIYDLGVHLLDLARFFLGEMRSLYCRTQRVNPRIAGEDVATILLESEAGATAVVELSYGCRPTREYFPQTLVHFEGALGSLRLGPGFELEVAGPDGTTTRRCPPALRPWSASPAEVIQDSIVPLLEHWVDCIRRGREPETSGRDNLRTLELVFGAYRSAASGFPYRTGEHHDL